MSTRNPRVRLVLVTVVTALYAVSVSCGGGGGGGGGPKPLVPTFTPSNASPGADTVSMQAGTVSGETFNVDIRVTDTNAFFGAAFSVTFDPAVLRYNGMGDAASFLRDNGAVPYFQASQSPAGTIVAVATRKNPDPGVDVTGTRTLVQLSFTALKTSAGSPMAFSGSLEVCSDAIDPQTNQCVPITVTWSGGTARVN